MNPLAISDAQSESQLRFAVDNLDTSIAQLIKERALISNRLQQSRVRSGGARVDISREREVLAAYAAQLGTDGIGVARAVLTFCRGEVVNAVRDEPQG